MTNHNSTLVDSTWAEESRPRIRLDEVISRRATQAPNATAIIEGPQRRTFAELDGDIDALASTLRQRGVGYQDRVAVALQTGALAITTLYAVSRVGAVAVPLNAVWTDAEVADVLSRSGAKWVLADVARTAADGPVQSAVTACDELDERFVGILHSPAHVSWTSGSVEVQRRATPPQRGEGQSSSPTASHEDVAILLFTSGSTGAPKGVLLTHEGVVGAAYYIAVACGLGPDDRMLQVLPTHHIAGIVDGFLNIHVAGGACLPLDFEPSAVLELLEQEEVTYLCAVESMLDVLFQAPGYSPERHPTWRKILTAVSEQGYNHLKKVGVEHIITGFGMTETHSNFALTTLAQTEDERRSSRWLPLPGVDVAIVDTDTGELCAPGETGELRVRGWNVMPSYLDGTSARDKEGYFSTGDLGRLLPSGAIHYVGRIKGIIKTRGEDVVAYEVERLLRAQLVGVARAVVVGVPDHDWGESLVAFVEFEPGQERPADILRDECAGRIPDHMIPGLVVPVAPGSWPLMAAGKVDRPELSQRALHRVSNEPMD